MMNAQHSLRFQCARWVGALELLIILYLPLMVFSKCELPALFNFGDSTSDTGGIHVAFPFMTLSESLPYGETYFHRAANRYSDGRLLIDFLAHGLGKPFLSPFLQSIGSNFTHGANFASSGATAKDVTFISPFSLSVQVNQFKVFKEQVSRALGQKGQQDYLPQMSSFTDGLYVLQSGGNDFTYGYMNLKMTPRQLRSYLPGVVRAISNAIKDLYEEGAKTFWVMDVGPQGCMPFVLSKYRYTRADLDENGCAKPYNDAVIFYNNLLKVELKILEEKLPRATVVYVNTYDIQYGMIQNARSYGFEYTTKACCGVGGQHNYNYGVQCGSTGYVYGQYLIAQPCVDPSTYINWDGVHLTDHANQLLARKIFSGTYFHPSFPLAKICPSNLNNI